MLGAESRAPTYGRAGPHAPYPPDAAWDRAGRGRPHVRSFLGASPHPAAPGVEGGGGPRSAIPAADSAAQPGAPGGGANGPDGPAENAVEPTTPPAAMRPNAFAADDPAAGAPDGGADRTLNSVAGVGAADIFSPSTVSPGNSGHSRQPPKKPLTTGAGGDESHAPPEQTAEEQTAAQVADCLTLNEAQRACVQAFVKHPKDGSRVLLQGPPGTGKTETLAGSVLTWLAARMLHGGPMGPADSGGIILLSGPTHTAIDTVAKRIYELLQKVVKGNVLHISVQLAKRIKLVRLSGTSRPIDAVLKQLGAQASVPATLERGVWYIVAGTLTHLVKAASDLRTKEAERASEGRCLMEDSGKGAFASALLLDEASMVFAPQLLALGSLLVACASLLVAGDHRQLAAIIKHDFAGELRPNLLRYSPHVSAYDYVQRLAAAEAEAGGVHVTPPPIAVCALTFSMRLPAVVRSLISPLYALDGITLEGRPPADAGAPPAHGAAPAAAPASRPGAAGPDRDLRTDAAAGAHVPHHPAMSDATAAMMRRVWQLAEVEGLFLIVHYEAESARSNDLEVEIVRQLLLARPQAAPAGDGGGNGGGGGGRGRGHGRGRGRGGGAAGAGPAGNVDGGGGVNGGDDAGGAQADGSDDGGGGGGGGGGDGGGGPGAAQADGGNGSGGGGGGGDGSIAIITPHRAQRRALQALVQELGVRKCTTETVERMQGGQANTVIFSATVSDVSALERASEFYTSLSRANTAFSRAQQRLIVVVSRTFLVHLPQSIEAYKGLLLWRKLQGMCQQRGKLLGEVFVGVARGDAGAGGGVEQDGTAAAGQRVSYLCDVYQGVA